MDVSTVLRFVMMPVISSAVKGVNWEEGNRLLYLRTGFMAAQILTMLIYGLIYYFIQTGKDERQIEVPIPKLKQQPGGAKTEKMTVQQYDMSQLFSLVQGAMVSMGITLFLHFKFGFIPPLCMGIAMMPLQLWGQKLFQLHIIKKPEEPGKTTRPFPQAPGLMSLLQGATENQAAAAPAAPATAAHPRSD